MKHCKKCGAEIAKSAKVCPQCGAKLGMPGFVKFLIIVAVVLVCVIACVASCTKGVVDNVEEAIKETQNEYKDINGKTSFKVGETFQNKHEKITMTEAKETFTDYSQYSKPASGHKYVMVKFEIENISESRDEIYVSSLSFNGYADGVAIETAYVGNDKYKDLSATLGKGKKAIGYIFYEVPTDAQKITLEYNADFWSDGTNIEFVIK